MNLLFFSQTLHSGGAERVLANITNELINRGHSITIALNENKISYQVDSRINICIAPQIKQYQGRNVIRRLLRNMAINRRNRLHTRNVIKTVHPEVIVTFLHCNMFPIICYHGNIPIVHSEHNAFDRRLGWEYHFRRFYLNRFFDKVLVLTPFDQGYAMAKGLENTIVMPNPNTFSSITQKEYDDLFPQRKNILACGRVYSWYIKGFDSAIEAFANVANQYPDVDLDIAGDADEKAIGILKQLAIKFDVENRIHFLGRRDDIDAIMRQHQLFILSSRTEGFPMVVTEAMSQGLPCIAFERLASSIILDGLDGCLIKDADTMALSEAIVKLVSNEKLRYSFGKAGLNNVSRFAADTIATKWEGFLSTINNDNKNSH